MKKSNTIVIALGGSLIVPNDIDTAFLKRFRDLLLQEIKKGKQFLVITGGGKVARKYIDAASQIGKVSDSDLDWLGIAGTKMNAVLLRVIFQGRVEVASGLKPGWSTDYIAVKMAQKSKAKEIIIAGDTAFVYDKDPKKYKNAKPISEISWTDYQKLIPKKWKPGLSSPVDPVAARLARKIGLCAKIIKGTDLSNFKNTIDGKVFQGTLIS